MELHGGIFERELVYDHTDYLIVRNTMSEKYKTAIEWKKVIIVNEYWVEDSTRTTHNRSPSCRRRTRAR